ncbi:DMT family transporter [Rhizobium sp. TRM95111]|uniref:DMT family transporter n=1 Tax=Rhizobium alarense TaxID=2846851 RepID=UPI001F268A4D|nr:DMT family transporter [Rhizobium alarense]MCF3639920.1 DMT family transporter [Rhizobium alarense]
MSLPANHRGALYMAAAMAGFTANDALVKAVTGDMNTGQIMFVRGLMTTALVLAVAHRFAAFVSWRAMLQPALLLRIAAEIGAAITYISALGTLPLANTASILQALPLAVTLGAALFLGERVGWRRWLAIVAGFVGVLIVIRPGPEGFTAASAYVVASVVFAAIRDLCTRRIDGAVPSLFITAVTAATITLFGALLVAPMGGWQPVAAASLLKLAGSSVLLFVGYQCIVLAMRTGEISFIAPFRYTSLFWAIGIGILVFGEVPDAWMATGVSVIVASGLYTFYRENKRKADGVAQESVPESP